MMHFCYGVTDSIGTTSRDVNILPWPKHISLESTGQFVLSNDFSVHVKGDYNPRINTAISYFLDRIDQKTGILFIDKDIVGDSHKSNLIISIKRQGDLELFEDESYTLKITASKILLNATTDLGAIHGLETLLQLLTHNKTSFFFPLADIADTPRFPWRGLMIDVARHYQPVHVIKRNIAAMSAVKLNVFHWHLSDDQGFRVEIKSYPKLQELASDGLYYTQEEIKEVVQFASDKGIRVIPEIDVPGHATAILTAYPELASKDTLYHIERGKGVFDATLDPTNKQTYEFLESIISELAVLFPDKYFHIGGDENKGKHWGENIKIQEFKRKNNLKNNHEIQTFFNIKLQEILKKNGKIMMGWDEIFQPNLPKDIVIHSWRGKEAMIESAKKGYQSILSKGYYIDLLFDTKTHYVNDPIPLDHGLKPQQLKNILGGEATMWAELVSSINIDSRIWPRTAAIAERFWSEKTITDFNNLIPRLNAVSISLEDHGLTHLKSRRQILRNLFQTLDIEHLVVLSEVCKPITARERVGQFYKTFHPLTLFVDACTPDTPQTIRFFGLVQKFMANQENKEEIIEMLTLWKENHQNIMDSTKNPILNELLELSKTLEMLSEMTLKKIKNEEIFTVQELKKADDLLVIADMPIQNVRLAIVDEFKSLIKAINTHY
ncbi:beta-N-acetylhexosaminidase [Aquimarina sp. AU474]|uniref:beta-N-acetylhexosaminidase n=1 Tax=Aquimarina sp. AU474 TaxID=2108529 RepID=UPI001358754C|nr:family 20 glycosylhydrolase [Aquimarina sp. AU474]